MTAGVPGRRDGGGDGPRGPGGRRPSFIESARRAQIVRAAIETIAEVGYAGATFARIAARAGVSPGLISYHFAAKDQLIDQIVVDVEAAMDLAITAATEGAESYGAALRALIETQVRYFGEHPDEVRALGQIFTHAREGTPAAATAAASRRRALEELESLFAEAQRAGEFGDVAPRAMAVTLFAALEAVPRELFTHAGTDVEAYARDLATIFERAVRPPMSD